MTLSEIESLERDVEAARRRVVDDLARVRSVGNASGRKLSIGAEAARMKDEAIEKAKEAARERATSFLDGVKARVAANPAAAAAIGAGLAWRLYRHPPIATVLVGAGLYGLLRADPRHPALGAGAARNAVGFGAAAKDRFEDWRSGDGPPRLGDIAAAAKDGAAERIAASSARVSGAVHSATNQVAGLVGAAHDRANMLAHDARDRVSELGAAARGRIDAVATATGDAAEAVASQAQAAAASVALTTRRAVRRVATDEHRDQYLLGAAGLALAAAIGLAYQRRIEPVRPPPRSKVKGRQRRASASAPVPSRRRKPAS